MDAKIKELLTHLSFFADDGMGEPKLVEFAKKADALLLEVARKPNTQQPVAWAVTVGNDIENQIGFFTDKAKADACFVEQAGEKYASLYLVQPLYTAPPVPRDVLLAFGEEVHDAAINAAGDSKNPSPLYGVMNIDLAAIADRYASKVQPERCTKCNTPDLCEEYGNACVDHPEPVNQQMLARCIEQVDACMAVTQVEPEDNAAWLVVKAAAEAAQPVVQTVKVPAGKNRYGLDTPYFVRWLNRVIPSLENYKPAEFAREFGRMAAAADKAALLADQQPASAQPVAVPDEMFVSEFAPRTVERYAAGWNDCRAAMLSAAKKPEGGVK